METNLDKIKQIFNKMRHDGWDTGQPLKWGFFFVSEDQNKLKEIYSELKEYSYKLESLHQAQDQKWVLQASKTEVLAPEKLHSRNISFNKLADSYNSAYDGWDVGKK